jgi:hypothetical protein
MVAATPRLRPPRIWTPEAKTTDGTFTISELCLVALHAKYVEEEEKKEKENP